MGPGSSSFLPPAYPPANFVTLTPTTIELLDPEGRLQRYTGIFNLQDLAKGKHDTSLFTGYQQFAGGSASTSVLYEISGGSLNGQILIDAVKSDDIYGLAGEIFKGADLIEGSAQSDTLIGFSGNDELRGGGAADVLSGGDGNDSISGNQGADSIDGGAGSDVVRAGQGDDVVRGGDAADLLIGDLGDDVLNGNQGGDSLDGGAGQDALSGGLGDDLIIGGDDNDKLFGDLGNDTLTGNAGNDTLAGGLGADRFVLTRDFDVIADFKAGEGDTIAVLASNLPYSLADSADGLQIIRAGFGITTLTGISTATFDADASIIVI